MKSLRLIILLCAVCAVVWAQDESQPGTVTTAPVERQVAPADAPTDNLPSVDVAPEDSAVSAPASSESAPLTESGVESAAASGNEAAASTPTAPPEAKPDTPRPATAQGTGANAQVRVTLDPPEIPFHKQTRFTIAVEAPANADVKIPHMVDKFGGLSVYGQPTHSSSVLENGRKLVTETYTLDPVLIGDYPIEPVTVAVDGEAITIASPSVRVRDLTPEEKEEAERFVSGATPIDLPLPLWRRWEFWAVVALVAFAIAVLIWWLARHRERIARPAPPLPAWEVAYQRLRELDERKLPQAGRTNVYYVELSSILRHYIEDRFEVHAPEQTTPEFLAEAANKHVFTDEQQRMLATFLRHCDRVKFARYEPTIDEMDRSFAEVLRFVDETKPKPEPDSEEKVA